MAREDVRDRMPWARPRPPEPDRAVAPAEAGPATPPAGPAAPPPPDLPSRLALALDLLEPPVRCADAGAVRRANRLGHALEQARAALRRALALARQG